MSGGVILPGADGEMPNMPDGWEYKINAPRTPQGLWEALAKNSKSGELARRFGKTGRIAMEQLKIHIESGGAIPKSTREFAELIRVKHAEINRRS